MDYNLLASITSDFVLTSTSHSSPRPIQLTTHFRKTETVPFTTDTSLDWLEGQSGAMMDSFLRDVQAEYALSLMRTLLSDKEKYVIRERYYNNRTYEDISSDPIFERKVSHSNVQRICNNAIRKMQLQVVFDAKDIGREDIAGSMKKRMKKYIGKGYKAG